jgi:hypothetical protein
LKHFSLICFCDSFQSRAFGEHKKMMPVILSPGVYFVGDLQLVLNDQRSDQIRKDLHPFDPSGCYQLGGLPYYNYWLAGRGQWQDTQGRSYTIDSGCVGVMRLSAIDDRANRTKGQVIDFPEPFIAWKDAFCIRFGKEVTINLQQCGCRPQCEGDCPDSTNE